MKRIVLLITPFIFFSSALLAQNFHLQVIAGPNYSNFFPYPEGNEVLSRAAKVGYNAGALVAFVNNHYLIETGAIFEQFNSETSYNESSPYSHADGTYQYSVRYLQVPLNLLYRAPTSFGNVFFGFGPYIAFGLSGTITDSGSGGSIFASPNSYANTSAYKFNPYAPNSRTDDPDYGLKIKTGISFNRFSITVSADHGMRYDINGAGNLKNDVYALSFGYTIF